MWPSLKDVAVRYTFKVEAARPASKRYWRYCSCMSCKGKEKAACSICVEHYLAVVHPLTFIRFKPLRFRVCSICVERYLAVVHPLTFIRFKPLRYRVVCSGLMWFAILCCICLERYLAVVHPLTFIRFKPLRFRVFCSGLMWFAITVHLLSIWTADVGYLFTCSICVERYLAVVHPLTFIRFKPLRIRVICSVLHLPGALPGCRSPFDLHQVQASEIQSSLQWSDVVRHIGQLGKHLDG
ncbi:unnamed protein product [Gadus morhua 'NCC']